LWRSPRALYFRGRAYILSTHHHCSYC